MADLVELSDGSLVRILSTHEIAANGANVSNSEVLVLLEDQRAEGIDHRQQGCVVIGADRRIESCDARHLDIGYPPSCRLAAYLHGQLQLYLAQTTVHHHTAPVPCASHRVPGGHPRPRAA